MKTKSLSVLSLLAILMVRPSVTNGQTAEEEDDRGESSWLADYLTMDGADGGGGMVTVGWNGADKRMLSVLDWMAFFEEDPVSLGLGGNAFSYRGSEHAASYSILGFGPVLRLGRLLLNGQFHLFSFRSQEGADEWRPGFVARVTLPLVNFGNESSSLLFLVPMPAAGIEWWFDDRLDHDETLFWVGLTWPGGIGTD